jgi:hypothetical protein
MYFVRALCTAAALCLVFASTCTASSQQSSASSAPETKEAERISRLAIVNGRPYDRPSHKDQFQDYVRDSYGWPAFARSSIRSLYGQSRGKPDGWGQDWPGYGQRFGSAVAVTAINGNVRYGMETLFHEDMRYIPCHGCGVKRKVENALLAEITARHDENGHRFFTLTPVISDFSGPLIANAAWYPRHDPMDGVIASRVVFATRIGGHLFTEFVLERRHKEPKLPD